MSSLSERKKDYPMTILTEIGQGHCGEVPVEFELQYRWHPRLGEWHFRENIPVALQ